jgi:phytol kinase
MNPSIGIALVLGLLAALMLGVRAAQVRGAVSPELARKLVHLGMGSVCLAFPWIFSARAPVWGLAALAAGGLTAIRVVPAWRVALGGVLGGVGRISFGEIYFPVAVALVFTLAHGDRALFCAPIAILTYADAAGALVGQRWGRLRYPAVESTKSIEGSAAVFATAWLSVALVLAVIGAVPPARALLVGVSIALFAALVEAVSWRGLDNLLLPIVAFAQLRVFATLDAADLIGRAAVMIALTVFMLNWRRHLLNSSARLGAALAMYLFWSLGDWQWLVAPSLLLVSYVRLMPSVPGGPDRHDLAAVVCIASAGVGPAVANAWSPHPGWLWIFTLGLATHQAIIAAVRFSQGRPRWPRWQWWLVAVLQAAGVQTIGFLAANGVEAIAPLDFAVGPAAIALALAGFMAWDRRLALPDDLNARWWRQGITAVLASAAGFILMRS